MNKKRFVGKYDGTNGWRIWDIMQKKWWGEYYRGPQENLLKELNENKQSEQITKLIKQSAANRKR